MQRIGCIFGTATQMATAGHDKGLSLCFARQGACCTGCLRRKAKWDVQHRIYDEVHDASPWTLFLLSKDLHALSQGTNVKIYLMTATTKTRIYAAVLKAVQRTFPTRSICEVDVPPLPGRRRPIRMAKEITPEMLPANFEDLSWTKQTCKCIVVITRWAKKRRESAAILTLKPGDKEMQQVIAEWFSVSSQADLGHVVFRVDSHTPKSDRKFIRSELKKQGCRFGMPHSLTVATKVFESSITLPINGLVNTGMAIDPDLNGHLKLFLCTLEQNIQRKGRAGRVFMSS